MPKYYTTIASAERIMELDDLPNEKEINKKEIDVLDTYKTLILLNLKIFRLNMTVILFLITYLAEHQKGDF